MVRVLVDFLANCKTVRSKWIFKKKTDMDGIVHTYKARLVAKGYTQLYSVDYEETFLPIGDIRAIRILISIAAFYDYEIWQMDVKTVFLKGYLDEDIYMVQPESFIDPNRPRKRTAVKNILKYLRNNKDMILVYGVNLKAKLRVDWYCNAGFETDRDDTKSQTWYVFILNGGTLDWKSSKESTTVMSAIEAKYIAASKAEMEAVWIRKFILGLGEIRFLKVYIDDNLTDPFTKALSNTKFTQHARSMGLRLASSFM
uniref:Putative zinc finger, CCHC-type n=1 Tax=Tanacetum cinerariifolium TaxID=118510 RepID=A0A699HPR9_TANCI|nr:putative zinc finger, CCHC-type [Tanacetum cinerariifolium]